jgi:hypothetical protein
MLRGSLTLRRATVKLFPDAAQQVFRDRYGGCGSSVPYRALSIPSLDLSQKQETALATPTKEARERAELKFKKKEIEARDASKAMADYRAGLNAEREKTARLKALREAKEAAEVAAARLPKTPERVEAKTAVKATRKTKANAADRKASSAA